MRELAIALPPSIGILRAKLAALFELLVESAGLGLAATAFDATYGVHICATRVSVIDTCKVAAVIPELHDAERKKKKK